MYNLSFSFISFNYYTHSCEITGIFPFIFFHIVLSTVFFNSNIFFNLQIFCFYILTYSTILSFLYSYVLYNLEFALTGMFVEYHRWSSYPYFLRKGACSRVKSRVFVKQQIDKMLHHEIRVFVFSTFPLFHFLTFHHFIISSFLYFNIS